MPQRPRTETIPKTAPEREKGEAERLFLAWRQSQNPDFRERLICQHLYLVQAVARKFTGLGESPEDLVSEGVMGLINAVDLYDPDRGVQFSTYATHLIDGQIRHYLRDKSKLIREPAWIQERLTRITRAAEAITHQMGRPARLAEIAAEVQLSEAQVREALMAQERTRVSSLDGVRSSENDDTESRSDLQRLLADSDAFSGMDVEDRLFLQQSIGKLKELEQKVLHHFYYLDLNQSEIARKLGISVNYASYLLRGALAKLKQAFEAQEKVALETSTAGLLAHGPSSATVVYSLPTRSTATDSQAGLLSEDYFRQTLSQEVTRATRYPQQFAFILVEPDGAADWSADDCSNRMRDVAARTKASVRMVDLVARLGRWRLGVLLPHTGREASVVAERLVARFTGDLPVSAGLAVFPSDGAHETTLEEHACRSLLAAQSEGGKRVCRLAPLAPEPAPEPKPKRTRRKKTTA
jgi:RNA polymerase sigma-B factor